MATPQSVSPVYISGPMFSHADKKQQKEIADALETAKMTTYLPQRDGIEVAKLMKHIGDPDVNVDMAKVMLVTQFIREMVFAMDMFQLLSRCNSLVFNMDGRVPDEGSVSETSAGWASGQPVVIYKTTPITLLGGTDNPMVDGLSMTWVPLIDKVEALPNAILTLAGDLETLNATRFTPGTQVAGIIQFGQFVWSQITNIDTILDHIDPKNPEPSIDALIAMLYSPVWKTALQTAYPNGPNLWPTS